MDKSIEAIVLELVFIPKDLTAIILSYLAGFTGKFIKNITGVAGGPSLSTPLACAIFGDNLAIVEHRIHRIQVWNHINWSLKYVFARNENGPAKVSYPRDIVIVGDELIFSNPGDRDLLILAASDGTFVTRWSGNEFPIDNGLDPKRSLPRGMAALKDELFVFDGGLFRIAVFDIKTKQFKRSWGRRGNAAGDLCGGIGHMSISNDELYITGEEYHCVQVFNPHDGKFKRKFGKEGEGPGELQKPKGILVLDHEVYVSSEHRITVFSKDGSYLRHWGTKGSYAGEFDSPHGLAFLGDQLLVTDFKNGRLQCFY